MSGWINFYNEQINCPFCNEAFIVQFIEDGDVCDPPSITTSLAGDCQCPACKSHILDADLSITPANIKS